MGNPTANSLPRCQLDRLQKMVDVLCSQPWEVIDRHLTLFGPKKAPRKSVHWKEPVRFWMDTLCVPVRDEDARKKAIRSMRNVYENADGVLVLDSWIQEVKRSSHLIEKAARLFLCNWHYRLWTLQEAAMAHNLFVQFKDGPEAFRDLHRQTSKSLKMNRAEGYAFVPFHMKMFSYPIGNFHYFNAQAANGAGGQYSLCDKLILWLEELGNGTTSRKSDETICLATLLDIPRNQMELLLNIAKDKTIEQSESENRFCEQRMAKFLEIIGRDGVFDQEIIFSKLPRVQIDGFRWAPRSFLGQSELIKYNNLARYRNPDYHKPGEYYFNFRPDRGQLNYPEGGLLVTYPGIKLAPVHPRMGTTIKIVPRDSATVCCLSLEPNEHGGFSEWSQGSRYAVILNNDERAPEAMLGILNEEDDRYLGLQYVSTARVQWMQGSERREVGEMFVASGELVDADGNTTIFGEQLEERLWCVR
jgi:hypothetical protein